ncbi:hypothetical protein DXC01_00525 [Blautia sp. OM07-19]|nr:hypothetical protein DWX28_04560 [Blautia sp. AF19-10LB]RHV06609.1 hypothetical protein DXC01_00525 [Blautia sp. OM07-19]
MGMCVVEVTEGRRGAKHARPHTKAAWPSRGSLRGSFGLRRLRDAPPQGFHILQNQRGSKGII